MNTRRIIGLLVFVCTLCAARGGYGSEHDSGVYSADEALQQLIEGNKRYMEEHAQHPHCQSAWRAETARGQHPFAIVLTCADSRVAPEIVFDQGIGDLFVLRVAGNVVDDAIIGSIEYAAEHLGTHLLVVMGHERCGAVAAAVQGGEVPGHIGALVQAINPAVVRARSQNGDLLDNCVRINIDMVSEKLRHNRPILSHLVEEGSLNIIGAYYDLDDGSVQFMQ